MDEHWKTNNHLFASMSNKSLVVNIFIKNLQKVLDYLIEHPEIEELL